MKDPPLQRDRAPSREPPATVQLDTNSHNNSQDGGILSDDSYRRMAVFMAIVGSIELLLAAIGGDVRLAVFGVMFFVWSATNVLKGQLPAPTVRRPVPVIARTGVLAVLIIGGLATGIFLRERAGEETLDTVAAAAVALALIFSVFGFAQ